MSLSIVNSTNVPLLDDDVFLGSAYDNILDFAQITISIKCDTGYVLTYIYSQNKVDIDYQTSQTITAEADTQFYNVAVKDRYFKLQITANDGDMSVLNVQTIYKTSTTYAVSSGPSSNVTIVSPVNASGYVQTVITNTVDVSGSVTTDISGQTVDISGQSVIVSSTDISTIASALNNQRISANVWNNASVVQNGVSNAISPGSTTYNNTTMSCYGTSSQDAVIAVQFSNNDSTYYTTQYQYTLTAGSFGFSIACSAYHIRLILLSPTTSTITAYINIC